MIRNVGVIIQDQISFGFLLGFKARLGCDAELVPPTAAIGNQRQLTRSNARKAWLDFQKKGVELIIRFTDADGGNWQQIRRGELLVFPHAATSVAICGVAVNNPEDWLCLDPAYIAPILGLTVSQLQPGPNRVGQVKTALSGLTRDGIRQSEVVARIVREVPNSVFRRWLADASLNAFYDDCRGAAARANCVTVNELDSPE